MKQRNYLFNLFDLSKSQPGVVIRASLYSVLNKLCDIVPEILIGIAIDIVVNQQHSLVARLGIPNPFHQLYFVGALTALLWIFESVFEYLYSISWSKIARDVQHQLRLKTYAAIQDLDTASFEQTTGGGLLHIIQNDITNLEQFLSKGLNEIIQLIVNIVFMGALFLFLSPTLALLTLLPIPFVIGISYYFQRKLARLYEAERETSSTLSAHIAHRLHGIGTIKSYATEQYEIDLLKAESLVHKNAQRNTVQTQSLYIPSVRMAVMFGFIATLVVGGVYVMLGYIPVNWYASLVFLTQRFLWPFTSLTTITDMYEKATASAKRILTLLSIPRTITSGTESLDIEKTNGAISFSDVSFAYPNGTSIFEHFNLHIPAKRTVAFVGATGSGKSTVIKLLLRLYDATSGSITIDGHDITDLQLQNLRSLIGVVSQDMYIIDGTIADNIAYGTFTASRDEIVTAAKQSQAHDFIMKLPKQYDTVLHEHGKNLSGGQRQRLVIARALLKKSPILIFDEATSAIDNETEAAIQETITSLKPDHTIVMIAHRLSMVRHADTIYVLDHGTIVESGNHEQLLEKNGFYAKLLKKE